MNVPRVAIVGGGFAGAAFALHLIRANGPTPLAIDIYEPRPLLGAGLAYSSADPEHRINVTAARMAVFAEDPTHFDRWFRETGEAALDPEAMLEDGRAYPRRAAFGRYVDQLLRTVLAAYPTIAFRHRRIEVAEVTRRGSGYRLRGADDTESTADCLILSTGHPAPCKLAGVSAEVAAHPRFIMDPWHADALRPIRVRDEALIVGTGLTMADVVASLRARGHVGPITAISRHGLTARPRTTLSVEAFGAFDRQPTRSVAQLLHRVRLAGRQAALEGRPWECVIDALRQQATTVWQALSPESRRRFLRHLRPWWDAHRYQIAPQVARVLAETQRSGQLKVMQASVHSLRLFQGSLQAVLNLRGSPAEARTHGFFDAVVNCTGPGHGAAVHSNPALRSLSEQGLLRADGLGLGVEVDHLSRVIGREGKPTPNLFVAGPLARGHFGELMGLPQVSTQPERLAFYVAALIRRAEPLERLVAAS